MRTFGAKRTLIVVLSLNPGFALGSQTPLQLSPNPSRAIIDNCFSDFVNEDILTKRGVKGVALAIVKPDDEVEYGMWGVRNEDNEEMTPDTLVCIASCSKAFLATSVGILMDDFANGRNMTPLPPGLTSFNWDTKVKDILPNDWKLQDQWASNYASVRDILSHVSGLPRHDLSYAPHDTPLDVIKRMRHLQPTFELREKWSYNNQMFMTGAHIVATLTNTSYPEFVRTRIFDPLGIPEDSATFSPTEAQQTSKLSQTWMADDEKTLLRIPFWIDQNAAKLSEGAGSIITSVQELSKWLRLHINKGVRPDTNVTIIPRDHFDALTTSTAIVQGKGVVDPKSGSRLSLSGYGLGWLRYSFNGHDVVYHTGSVPGFKTLVAFLPDDKLGVAVTFNTDLGPNTGSPNDEILTRVMSSVFGTRNEAPEPAVETSSNGTRFTIEDPDAMSHLAGTYSDKGYGSFILCASGTESEYCDKVWSDFSRVDSILEPKRLLHGKRTWRDDWEEGAGIDNGYNSTISAIPLGWGVTTTPKDRVSKPCPVQLLAEWSRVWSTHLRFVYLSSSSRNGSTTQTIHKFALRPTALFPKGYGDSTRPREPFELPVFRTEDLELWATAEFVEEDGKVLGIGLSGNGLVPEDATRWLKDRGTGDVVKDSLVWFERVD